MSRKKLDLVLENVQIESVAAEGKALAHVDGMVLFVEFAVPGDVVDVRVTKKKHNYMEGYTTRLVQPSPHRLKPFCTHFGFCGGCRWQPLPYEMQLDAKRQQVWDQFVRLGHLDVPEIRPTLPSERTEYYRNKLEFTASERRWIYRDEDPETLPPEELPGLGFHVGKFFDKVLDIKDCHLQRDPSNAIRWFRSDFFPHLEQIVHVVRFLLICVDAVNRFINNLFHLHTDSFFCFVIGLLLFLYLCVMLAADLVDLVGGVLETLPDFVFLILWNRTDFLPLIVIFLQKFERFCQ